MKHINTLLGQNAEFMVYIVVHILTTVPYSMAVQCQTSERLHCIVGTFPYATLQRKYFFALWRYVILRCSDQICKAQTST
jgi:hypothetical protein